MCAYQMMLVGEQSCCLLGELREVGEKSSGIGKSKIEFLELPGVGQQENSARKSLVGLCAAADHVQPCQFGVSKISGRPSSFA